MVRAITLACAFVVLFSLAKAAEDEFKCYQCANNCEEDAGKEAKVCTDGEKECYTYSKDGKEQKGCTKEEKFCEGKTDCEKCNESECNSASSITSSVILGVAAAMLLKFHY